VTHENVDEPRVYTESSEDMFYEGYRAALEKARNHIDDLLAEIPPPHKGQSKSVERAPATASQGRPIEDLDLSAYASNIMRRENVWTIDKLLTLNEDQLMRMPRIGTGTLNHIVARLRANGFSLGVSIGDVLNDTSETIEE
jgi:DNA-directed RNA polymerase alpha subunit